MTTIINTAEAAAAATMTTTTTTTTTVHEVGVAVFKWPEEGPSF
jgi:hypothetical protein